MSVGQYCLRKHHNFPRTRLGASYRGVRPSSSMPPADLRDHEFAKILLIKLSAVGDVVHTIPVVNKLRRRFPAAQLDWLVKPAIGELLRSHPAVSNVVEFAFDAQPFVAQAALGERPGEKPERLSRFAGRSSGFD